MAGHREFTDGLVRLQSNADRTESLEIALSMLFDRHVRHWQAVAEELSRAGLSWGCASEIDPTGRVIFTAEAYSHDGRRFIVLSDQKLAAFLELASATRDCGESV